MDILDRIRIMTGNISEENEYQTFLQKEIEGIWCFVSGWIIGWRKEKILFRNRENLDERQEKEIRGFSNGYIG